MKAIAVEPGERYQTAEELADDIVRWQNQESVVANRFEHPVDVMARFVSRNPISVMIVGLMLLAMVVGLRVLAVRLGQSASALAATVQNRDINGDPVEWAETTLNQAKELNDFAASWYLDLDEIDELELDFKIAEVKEMKGDTEAEKDLRVLLAKIPDGRNDLRERVLNALGRLAFSKGDNPGARRWYEEAAGLGERAKLKAQINLAQADISDGKPDKALERLQKVLDEVESEQDPNSLDLAAKCLLQMSIAELELDNPNQAVARAKRASDKYAALQQTNEKSFVWQARHAWELGLAGLTKAESEINEAYDSEKSYSQALRSNEIAGKNLHNVYSKFSGNPDFVRTWALWNLQRARFSDTTMNTLLKVLQIADRMIARIDGGKPPTTGDQSIVSSESNNSTATKLLAIQKCQLDDIIATREFLEPVSEQVNSISEFFAQQAVDCWLGVDQPNEYDDFNRISSLLLLASIKTKNRTSTDATTDQISVTMDEANDLLRKYEGDGSFGKLREELSRIAGIQSK